MVGGLVLPQRSGDFRAMMLPEKWNDGVDGWLEPGQPEQLAELAAAVAPGNLILEIGSFHGLSTLALLAGAKISAVRLLCCDTFNGSAEHAGINADHFMVWRENILRKGYALPLVLVGRSEDALPLLPAGSCGLVFIDGCHQYPAVQSDWREAVRLTKPGGVVALHDVCATWPGPERVWNKMAETDLCEHGRIHSLRWGKRRR